MKTSLKAAHSEDLFSVLPHTLNGGYGAAYVSREDKLGFCSTWGPGELVASLESRQFVVRMPKPGMISCVPRIIKLLEVKHPPRDL